MFVKVKVFEMLMCVYIGKIDKWNVDLEKFSCVWV